MISNSTAMAIAEKRARSAKKTLEANRRAGEKLEQESATVASGADEKAKAKPPLRYRIRLLLTGALVALTLAAGAFFAFKPSDMGPPEGFDGAPASATDAGGPPAGLDGQP